ncbi:MAG: hypothetical protein IPH72_24220 [Sandaracinaceae bacterium]|nr:hypothetical protein [Sandaracinaceae bacterium]
MALSLGESVDARVPWVRALHDLDAARSIRSPGPKLRALRHAGEALGDSLRHGPRVSAVRTLPQTTLLYPTAYAFNHTVPLPVPYVVMSHRCLLVQVRVTVAGQSVLKNVLFNPSDIQAAKATPYFAQLLAKTGDRFADAITTRSDTLEAQLARHGLGAEDIDLIAFDHFHTQDLRSLLGCDVPNAAGELLRARFPNAYLLAPRLEWEDWDDLHPMQRSWFIADGKRGVPLERVVLTDGDVALGEGCLLLQTPGHTTGNQTLFCYGERGVFGCSENGTSADNWSPYESRIPGLARYSRQFNVEVVLNSNTPELAAEQYASMVLERSVVDRVPGAPAFVQMFPSSEVTPSALAPGIWPSMIFGERDSGHLQVRPR